ncbi:MAG: hypothetical protein DYG96_09520 [Chlorobi bacterium CHB2]|nr:hypothetical protein [Chlorobi bacterium CHB2]
MLDRRTFLKIGGVGIAGVVLVPLLDGCEQHTVTPLTAPELVPFLTPQAQLFVQHGGEGSIPTWAMPDIKQEEWKLEIGRQLGATFSNNLTITFADLMQAKADGAEITFLKTMQCILESPLRVSATGYTGNAYWTGIPLKHFLDKAGIDYNLNRRILLYGADKPSDGSRQFGFINNLTVDRIINGESQGLFPPILAYAMNGEPLTREHGFPVRLIVHEMYGFSNVKWLVRASATQAPQDTGTYQLEGYTERVIQASSRGTSVREGVSIPRGETVIRGFAISGHAAISTVEISIDGGPFAPATITPLAEIQDQESLPPSIQQLSKGTAYPYQGVWTPWTFRWDAPGGTHTIAIRATDAAGNTQPDPDDSISDGQNGVVKYKVTVS